MRNTVEAMKLPAATIWTTASSKAPVSSAEASKPTSPRTSAASPIRLAQIVRLARMVLVSIMSVVPCNGGGGCGEPEGLLFDRENPPTPAGSEDRPCGEAGEAGEPCPGQAANRLD